MNKHRRIRRNHIQKFQPIKKAIKKLGLQGYINSYLNDENQSTYSLLKQFENPYFRLYLILENCLSNELKNEYLTISEKLYYIANGYTTSINFCEIEGCNGRTKYNDINSGYNRFCSKTCQNRNPSQRQKIGEASKKNWAQKSEKEKNERAQKMKQSRLEKYGVKGDNVTFTTFKRKKYSQIKKFQKIKKQIRKFGLIGYINKYIESEVKVYGLTKIFSNKDLHLSVILNNCLSEKLKNENLSTQEKLYYIVNEIKEPINFCKIEGCNNKTKLKSIKKGYNQYCSKTCRNKNSKLREAVSKALLESWKNVTIEEIDSRVEKMKNTNIERYGSKTPYESPLLKDKIKKIQFENRFKKIKEEFPNIEILKTNNQSVKKLEVKCQECENIFNIDQRLLRHRVTYNLNPCIYCNPPKYYTKLHAEIANFITNLGVNMIENTKEILDNNYEFDIYLPDYNLAFEINGTYWHSDFYKNRNYHVNKKELAEEKGIELIHIWEDYWQNSPEIIKSRIKNKLGLNKRIFARKCEIREINSKQAKQFLNRNHLQQYTQSKIKIGLFYQNQLVSVMTFGDLRKALNTQRKNNQYELLRFANKLDTTVVGGANKLFQYFIRKFKPEYIVSYASRDWSSGDLYFNLGFTFIHKTNPGYYWMKNGERFHRFNFRKSKLVDMGFDPNKTESEIMYEEGFHRIYDSGNLKFIWQSKN